MALSDKTREAAQVLVDRYPVARSAVLPLLHLVQSDQGYVTEEGIAFCAEMVGLTKAEVAAVATFYTMFKREPVGDYLLSICTNPTCKNAGAVEIYERFQAELGGHRDPETGVSVEHAECLGICDAAPVIQVNYEMYGPCTDEQADQILAGCRKGEPPVSNWSNERPPTFKEVEWELSGAADPFNHHLIEAARQQVAYEVPPAYRSGETDIPVTHAGGDPRGVGGAVFRSEAGGGEGVPEPRFGDADRPTADREAAEIEDVRDTADETRGVAEERAATVGGEAVPPASPERPRQPAEGDVPSEVAEGEVTATDQSQVERRVAGPPDEEAGDAQRVQQHDEVPGVQPPRTSSTAPADTVEGDGDDGDDGDADAGDGGAHDDEEA